MKKILVMCPSRSAEGKRITNVCDLIESWKQTTTGNSDFVLGIDENDKHHYPNFEDIIVDVNTEQLTVIKKINYLSKKYLHNYEFIQFVGDDCVFKTNNWETKYLEASKNMQNVIFYPNDTIQGKKLCTHPLISTNIIKKLGFMGPPCLTHMYVDNFWMNLGNYLGCLKYFEDIILEHKHPAKGFESDSLYKQNDSFFYQDQRNFFEYMKIKFFEDTECLKIKDKK